MIIIIIITKNNYNNNNNNNDNNNNNNNNIVLTIAKQHLAKDQPVPIHQGDRGKLGEVDSSSEHHLLVPHIGLAGLLQGQVVDLEVGPQDALHGRC